MTLNDKTKVETNDKVKKYKINEAGPFEINEKEQLINQIERLKEKLALLEQELVLCEFENEMRKNQKIIDEENFSLETINRIFNTTHPGK